MLGTEANIKLRLGQDGCVWGIYSKGGGDLSREDQHLLV